MTWTTTNLVIQIIAGILGGHAAAAVAKEHSFGLVGHTIVGALGGAAGGIFLQTLAATVITASGSVSEPTAVENAVVQGLTGAVARRMSDPDCGPREAWHRPKQIQDEVAA